MAFKIVSRAEWKAQASERSEPLETPVSTVVVFPETDTAVCYTKKECIKLMQELQKTHKEKGHPDILFNFLVGLDGRVYEGTGWHVQGLKILRHQELDGKNISIAYIGNFEDWTPPYLMIKASSELIKYGVEQNLIDKNYRRGDIVWETNELRYDDDCKPIRPTVQISKTPAPTTDTKKSSKKYEEKKIVVA